MKYNNQLHILKEWCSRITNEYYAQQIYEQGISGIQYGAVAEISFKLMQLINQDFPDDASFYESIVALMNVHYDFALKRELTRTEKYKIDKVKKDFLAYVQLVLSDKCPIKLMEHPYERIITGPEANEIISQINSRWEYYNDSYWFPLMGEEPQSVTNKFFIMKKHVLPYWNNICDYILKCNEHIYSYGESYYDIEFCTETSTIGGLNDEEWSYTDKNYTWFIYLSHEDTISFAGTIVPFIKELLIEEKEHWDRYEYSEF